MNHDYYAILGIPYHADFAAIKRAYRAQALVNHPDRGGSHERMLLIIEAWNILSNPETRRRYDHSRKFSDDRNVAESATVDAEKARRTAQDYPREWSEFESWINQITWRATLAGAMAQLSWIAPSMVVIGLFHYVLSEWSKTGWLLIILVFIFGPIGVFSQWMKRHQRREAFQRKLSIETVKREFSVDVVWAVLAFIGGGYYALKLWSMIDWNKPLPAGAWAQIVLALVTFIGLCLMGLYSFLSWYYGADEG